MNSYDLVHKTPIQPDAPRAQQFGCLQCGLSFKSKGGEGAHMNRKHGYIAKERFLFDGTSCPACLKQYHSHSKVQAHLRYATACRERGLRFRCVPVEGAGSQVNRLQAAQHNGLLPDQVSDGAQLPPGPARDEDLSHSELWDLLGATLLDGPYDDADALTAALRPRIVAVAVSWTQFCYTLEAFLQDFTTEDAELSGCDKALLTLTFARLRQPNLWECFSQAQPEARAAVELRDYEAQCYEVVVADTPVTEIPRHFGRERILLHAYAGRRRPGDFQFFLDILAEQHPDMTIYTVSLDLVIDEQWGDVMSAATRAFWLDHARQGHILGFLAGPPCNTFSVARETELQEGKTGPRVVRSAQDLWGFSALTLKELSAVHMSNVLLGFALLMMIHISGHRGLGILEHPAEPSGAESASIWKLPLVQLMLLFPAFQRLRLLQGLFSAFSAKPTELLLLNLPAALPIFHAGRLVPEVPRTCSIGKHVDGTFKTTSLKEYPPAFCRCLARIFIHHLDRVEVRPEVTLPQDFVARCRNMTCTQYGERIGADTVV